MSARAAWFSVKSGCMPAGNVARRAYEWSRLRRDIEPGADEQLYVVGLFPGGRGGPGGSHDRGKKTHQGADSLQSYETLLVPGRGFQIHTFWSGLHVTFVKARDITNVQHSAFRHPC